MTTADQIKEAADKSAEIAATLHKIADAGTKLLSSGLTRDALILLLHRDSGVGMRDVACVLDAIPRLRRHVTTKPPVLR